MNQEDGDLELYKIEDMMILQKEKLLLSYLRMKDRLGIHILSNINRARVYSRYKKVILKNKLFYDVTWIEEIFII